MILLLVVFIIIVKDFNLYYLLYKQIFRKTIMLIKLIVLINNCDLLGSQFNLNKVT